MKRKLLFSFFLLFVMLPVALANVPIPLSLVTVPLLVPIILIEFLIFYLLTKKMYQKEIKWSKILLTVTLANLTTSFLGTFLLANFFPNEYSFLLTAFILSVLIEWGIYIILLRKEKLGKEELLKISILVHAASYLFMILIVYFFAHFLFETVFQFIENIAIFF